MTTTNDEARPFRVEFEFCEMPPMALIEKEYARLDQLKAEGVFVSLNLKPDTSGGTLRMRGRSRNEVDAAIRSLPLYPFAQWTVTEEG